MVGQRGYELGDAQLRQTAALPDGAAATQVTGLDLGHGVNGSHVAPHEILIEAPALTTTELPDTETMTYSIETDDNAAFSSATIVDADVLVQTGAGGAGAAAAEQRYRLPTTCERYVRLKATNSGAGDASGKSMTFSLKF